MLYDIVIGFVWIPFRERREGVGRVGGVGEGVGQSDWRGRQGGEISVDWEEGKPERRVVLVGRLVQVVPQLLALVSQLEGGDGQGRGEFLISHSGSGSRERAGDGAA